jgi:hypothetical protein
MGRPLRPPVGAFPEGDSFGYYLVSSLFISGFTGRVKSRPVSAFVGVKGEDIRTLRARRLQSAGRPQGRDPIQPLSATFSHMWIHTQPHVVLHASHM